MAARQFAVRNLDQQHRWREFGPLTGADDGPPPLRSLLHAAGMAPFADTDPTPAARTADTDVHGLPLVGLIDPQSKSSTYCAATTVDDRGRLADRTALKVMGWEAGTPTTISMIPSAGIILAHTTGSDAVTRQGYLRLPARIRHGCRLNGGDRLLVVARPDHDLLLIYTASALDAMASAYHASICHGEAT